MADPFAATQNLEPALLQAMVARLEARAKHPRFVAMTNEYLDAVGLDRTKRVLDIGCGSGPIARAIAARPRFDGHVTAIDVSDYLTNAGREFAAQEGLAGRVTFLTGDSRHLDLPDRGFDAVVAHTLLSHVDDPAAVLSETARLLEPDGHLAVFDGDYASLTFGRHDDAVIIGALVTSPTVMRQMPRLLRESGFDLVRCFAHVVADVGTADIWRSAIDVYERLLPQSGVMTLNEAEAWASTLREASSRGVFFASCNYYSYVARRRG